MSLNKWFSNNIMIVVVVLLGITFFVVSWGAVNWGLYSVRNSAGSSRLEALRNKKTAMQAESSGAAGSSNLRLTCADDDLASAFASVRPAVVNITADRVTQRKDGTLASSIAFDDPAIRFIEELSLGSGIIIDPRGFILTNAHVIKTAREIKVIIFGFDRKAYVAEIVGQDQASDIAILRIYPERPLPVAVLGDSDMIKVAQTVMAVGSPFGLEQSVTAGIVSDNSRDLVIEGQTYKKMIQTDAAINRGNSGGPLVNAKGEVIGINTAIYAPTGVFTGVGFAIPVNSAKLIIKRILANRKI